MLPAEAKAKYMLHSRRVQSGIKWLMELAACGKADYGAAEPKHLRVGVDITKADQGSLARLLIAKGVITEDEYLNALADGMEMEANAFEKELQEQLGDSRIKLGPTGF